LETRWPHAAEASSARCPVIGQRAPRPDIDRKLQEGGT